MSLLNDIPLSALHFYMTAPYPCSYLPAVQARSQVATPTFLINGPVYSQLVQHGFRRSGTYTYRPLCDGCRACVPLRVLSRQFAPNRSQRRAWGQHAHLQASLHNLHDSAEYYHLYQRYQCARHPNGGMDNDDRESYQNFLLQSHVDSLLVEFREPSDQDKPGALRMVSVIDLLGDGLSSVYTFYDPDVPRARFGVYNVLWQIELCRKLDLDFVYLGYWIEHSRKMAYKTGYRPAQGLIDGVWQPLDKGFP
ncbi:MAG: arginyltransferase [Gallionellales bacterium RIFCSPLOWO2_12_FULL_59_22]|nr:MAG: arginyltransferase [Gallionellales bacterium RIFCSPLOWO2_02_FULL_59_110]OGT03802.1 MAG: arginyltransferase [Gallionellales bacterium RIFCSPLOWO2_02_58_13]OGT11379.1 MAG: arginyltransferase [Gallionellales bacterium RIFCSPLOWO2_12_FULL_59_22]